jgi:hypothetical protein
MAEAVAVGAAEELVHLTADIAAQNPALVQKLEDLFKAKEVEFQQFMKKEFGATPQVQPVPQVSTEKSQADVIAEMQATIASLLAQQEAQKNQAANGPVVMEGGEPVPHNLVLDNGQWVFNHPGLATHYSVNVPATATTDQHDEIHTVVAAYPS